jgi:hypothetical protein
MARRILSHKALRADFDAAERRKKDAAGEGGEAVEEQDDEEDEGEEPVAVGEEGGEEEAPKKKRKPAAVKTPKPKRTRTPKVVRQRVVWGVFSNSNVRVATYPYPQEKEAREHAAKLQADKNATFFVQPVKEPIEEVKEKE